MATNVEIKLLKKQTVGKNIFLVVDFGRGRPKRFVCLLGMMNVDQRTFIGRSLLESGKILCNYSHFKIVLSSPTA